MEDGSSPERIEFLDHLRGLACLMVVFGHIYLIGINDPRTVSVWLPFVEGPIFGRDSPATNPFNAVTTWLVLEHNISFGPLGVAVFFLISGYIILRTVDREDPTIFLIRRVFRIFPLAIVVSLLIALGTAALCSLFGGESPHSFASVVATSFAAPGFFGTFSTIPVIWSLTVEVLFYLVMALAAALFTTIRIPHIIAISCLCTMFAFVTQHPAVRATIPGTVGGAVVTLGYCAFHTGFLLIGSAVYRARSIARATGVSAAIGAVGAVALPYVVSMALTYSMGDLGGTGTSYQNCIVAFIIFIAAMMAGLRWRAIRWFRWFGDISYPLYLIHIPIAWATMFTLARLGWGMHQATITSIVICVAISAVLHRTVEMPTHAFGRRFARRIGKTAIRERVPNRRFEVS